jgi:hypothetical protein
VHLSISLKNLGITFDDLLFLGFDEGVIERVRWTVVYLVAGGYYSMLVILLRQVKPLLVEESVILGDSSVHY